MGADGQGGTGHEPKSRRSGSEHAHSAAEKNHDDFKNDWVSLNRKDEERNLAAAGEP